MDISSFQVEPGHHVSLSDVKTSAPQSHNKEDARARVAEISAELADLQYKMYADGHPRVLVVIQATDTGGKDGTIRNVFGGLSPLGVRVANFKAPTEIELAHDYLWRVHSQVPASGELVVFNRSHYEDVLIVRVHDLVPEKRWQKRYEHIVDFERMLTDEGTVIVKLFLHISKDQQAERLRARVADPTKNWKFNDGDLVERKSWDAYQDAYTDMVNKTSTANAPWYVVPADQKWFRDLVVSEVMLQTLRGIDMAFPPLVENIADIVIE